MPQRIVGTNVGELYRKKQYDERRNISIRQFSKESKIAESTVTSYLRDEVRRFDSDTIIKMMDYFKLKTFNELFRFDEVNDETAKT